MALTIDINGKKLVTAPDFSCRINMKNPACMFDGLRGPLAADISLPKEGNRITLNHPDRFTKMGGQNDRKYTGASLRHFGIELIAGDLVIDDASENYSGWIQNLIGKLGEEMREKLISQMSLGGEQTFINKTNFDPLTDVWCTIKILNPGYFSGRGQKTTYRGIEKDIYGNDETKDIETELLTYKFKNESEYFVNATSASGVKTSAGTDGVVVVCPFPFVHQLIDLILKENQYYISDNFLKLDETLRTLCLYHTFNIVADNPTTSTTTLWNFNFYLNKTISSDFAELQSATWNIANFNLKDCLPAMKLKDLILGIQNTVNVLFWFDNNRGVRIVDRESILTGEAYDLSQYQVTPWKQGERKNVCIKHSWEHDSNDSAFNDDFSSLDDKREKILASVPTRPDLDSILLTKAVGDIRLVESENQYYEYRWHTVTSVDSKNRETSTEVLGWQLCSIGLQNYFFNDGDRDQEEIKSPFSTLRMSPDDGCPVAYQTGNSKTFSTLPEDFSPRLMFYKGNNTGGDESSGAMKFDWKGDQGILLNRWRLWLPFWANRLPVTAQFEVPTRVLKHIIENIYQKFRSSEGEFIIDEIDAEPGANKLIRIDVKAFKVEDNFWQMNPGVVVGGGDGTGGETFTPKFAGINESGKPYLVDETGGIRTTSIFGSLSLATYAKHQVVSYNPALKQLYVGGQNGLLHIYDLQNNFAMKSVQIFVSSDDLCSVRFLEYSNNILIGRQNTNHVYSIPCQVDINNYASGQVTAMTNSPCSGMARDFMNVGGFYYCITSNGELMKSNTPGSNWQELWDHDAHFTRFVITSNRYYILEDDDRPFWSYTPDFAERHDFDVKGGAEPRIYQGSAIGDAAIFLTDEGNFLINAPDDITSLESSRGDAKSIAGIYMCSKMYIGTTGTMWRFNGVSFSFLFYIPDALAHMFEY